MAGLPFDRKPSDESTVDDLLHMADQIGAMAAVAITQDAEQSLERLATPISGLRGEPRDCPAAH